MLSAGGGTQRGPQRPEAWLRPAAPPVSGTGEVVRTRIAASVHQQLVALGEEPRLLKHDPGRLRGPRPGEPGRTAVGRTMHPQPTRGLEPLTDAVSGVTRDRNQQRAVLELKHR